jgi:hypothetical protein
VVSYYDLSSYWMFALDFHHKLGYCHLVFRAIQEWLDEMFFFFFCRREAIWWWTSCLPSLFYLSMLFLPLPYLKPLPVREMHYPFHIKRARICTHTHTHILAFSSDCQRGKCIISMAAVTWLKTLYQEDWEVSSEQPDKNIDQIQRQESRQYNLQTVDDYR